MNTNKIEAYRLVIGRLKGLSSGKIKPKDPFQGVCIEMSDFIGDSGVVLDVLKTIQRWSLHSGVKSYPVPLEGVDPCMAYNSTKYNHWKGSYGDNRKKLCKWLADELSKDLHKALKSVDKG